MDMEEEIVIGDVPEEEKEGPSEDWIQKKLTKIRNLKHFRDWEEDKLREWVILRHGATEPLKELPSKDVNVPASVPDATAEALQDINSEEYKKKFNAYLNKYKKEFAVDMNDSNDAESLRSYVRYTIQLEDTDGIVRKELSSSSPDHRILKGLGDFQRSLQMNQNEIQDKLGISRKQRKEKVHDDIPKYIEAIQDKAKKFWKGKTIAVRCETCKIQLAHLWINFPDKTDRVEYQGTCEKCNQQVVFVV